MTLHLSRAKRICLVSCPSKQGEFSQSSKGSWQGEGGFCFPLCQFLPTWQERCLVWQLVDAICWRHFPLYQPLVWNGFCHQGGFGIFFGNIRRNLRFSQPQRSTSAYQRLWRIAVQSIQPMKNPCDITWNKKYLAKQEVLFFHVIDWAKKKMTARWVIMSYWDLPVA